MDLGRKLDEAQLQLILPYLPLQLGADEVAVDIEDDDDDGYNGRKDVDGTPLECSSSGLVQRNLGLFILDEQAWNNMETKGPVENVGSRRKILE